MSNQEELLNAVNRNGRIEVIRALLKENTIDANWRYDTNWTALHCACWWGRHDIVELLLDHGADIDIRQHFTNITPLAYLCHGGSPSLVKLLLDRGANIHAKDRDGYTPLHLACDYLGRSTTDAIMIVEYLLAHGADPSVKNLNGQTPLQVARSKGHYAFVEILERHQIEKELKENQGITATTMAQIEQRFVEHVTSMEDRFNKYISSMEESFVSSIEGIISTRIVNALKNELSEVRNTNLLGGKGKEGEGTDTPLEENKESTEKYLHSIDKNVQKLINRDNSSWKESTDSLLFPQNERCGGRSAFKGC